MSYSVWEKIAWASREVWADGGLSSSKSIIRRMLWPFHPGSAEKIVNANPQTHPEECLRQLLTFGEHKENKAGLIPTTDYYVTFISRFRDELRHHYYFNIPGTDVLDMLIDKDSQYATADRLGISISRTITPRSINHLLQEKHSLSYPVLIKGACGDEWRGTFRTRVTKQIPCLN